MRTHLKTKHHIVLAGKQITSTDANLREMIKPLLQVYILHNELYTKVVLMKPYFYSIFQHNETTDDTKEDENDEDIDNFILLPQNANGNQPTSSKPTGSDILIVPDVPINM